MTRPLGLERPHGTEAAYRRHCLYGQRPCRPCTEAHRRYRRRRDENRRTLGELIAILAALVEEAA